MIRSLGMSIALLTIVLLMSASSASARSGGTFVPTLGSAAQISAVVSAVNPSQILNPRASAMYLSGDGGNYGDHDDNKNGNKGGDNGWGKDKDKDHDRDSNAPVPEPSTILSFGAALLIGCGVLYSRRLHRNKK